MKQDKLCGCTSNHEPEDSLFHVIDFCPLHRSALEMKEKLGHYDKLLNGKSLYATLGYLKWLEEIGGDLLKALISVYQDIELQNVKGGSDELNIIVQQAIAKAEGT